MTMTPPPGFPQMPGAPTAPPPGPPGFAPPAPGVPGPPVAPVAPGGDQPTGGEVVNWNDLIQEAQQAGGFEVLPIGSYNVTIAEATNTHSAGGKVMFKIKYKVIDGPHAGKVITDRETLSPESAVALKFFFKHMAIFGMDAAYFAQQPSPLVVASNLVGKSATITIEHRLYQGDVQMDVKNVAPMGGIVPGQAVPVPQAGAPQPNHPGVPSAPPGFAPPQPVQQAPAPVPVQQPAPQPAPAPAQAPQLSPDGNFQWDGAAWQPVQRPTY